MDHQRPTNFPKEAWNLLTNAQQATYLRALGHSTVGLKSVGGKFVTIDINTNTPIASTRRFEERDVQTLIDLHVHQLVLEGEIENRVRHHTARTGRVGVIDFPKELMEVYNSGLKSIDDVPIREPFQVYLDNLASIRS